MMQEASKRRCNKIKFLSLSFLPKLNSFQDDQEANLFLVVVKIF